MSQFDCTERLPQRRGERASAARGMFGRCRFGKWLEAGNGPMGDRDPGNRFDCRSLEQSVGQHRRCRNARYLTRYDAIRFPGVIARHTCFLRCRNSGKSHLKRHWHRLDTCNGQPRDPHDRNKPGKSKARCCALHYHSTIMLSAAIGKGNQIAATSGRISKHLSTLAAIVVIDRL